RGLGVADVLDDLLEQTAQGLARDGAQLARDMIGGKGTRADGGKATASLCRDLFLEGVALIAQPLDLFEQHAALFAALLEDLFRGDLGALADLIGGAQPAREGVLDLGVVLLVDGDALGRGLKLRLEQSDALTEL